MAQPDSVTQWQLQVVSEHTVHCRQRYFRTKTLFDWCAAASGLVLLAPVMFVIALAVRLTSRGPILYRQIRVGINNQPFLIYKFRTMRVDAEKDGAQWARRNDPRVTPIGRFLRRTHLDELPQLINVLKGEMSLVGPRPERPIFVSELSRQIEGYPLRLAVKPGITGLAQVHHRYDESIEDVKVKLHYDLAYVQSCGFGMDLKIIWNTFWSLLTGRTHDVGAPSGATTGADSAKAA
ncbi:MAG TPA: sugar transferase [Candidatus Sumerlaeota bacterium]|nr:sugar transferase [Candidatus Sumerlaeota bacterium]HOR28924.1 sugar transferase [Candidatus Sumerlaeota bacterium]HPK03972.1 sugar transferase [Candidatus Sumerlaeota bacterium]